MKFVQWLLFHPGRFVSLAHCKETRPNWRQFLQHLLQDDAYRLDHGTTLHRNHVNPGACQYRQ